MTAHIVKILDTQNLTHDVKRFLIEKPEGYSFEPGQATEVSINKPEWANERRPFTFTSLNDDPHLEFVIKGYHDHKGVTDALHSLTVGDELLIHDVWGAIRYKGKGVFIAGGAGITPFIAIFRQLHKDRAMEGHQLLFSNRTAKDIILKEELERTIGTNFINAITDEWVPGTHQGRIDKNYLEEVIHHFNQHFYVCGPEQFTKAITKALIELGAGVETVVFEK